MQRQHEPVGQALVARLSLLAGQRIAGEDRRDAFADQKLF
jgi:hypothetical protein